MPRPATITRIGAIGAAALGAAFLITSPAAQAASPTEGGFGGGPPTPPAEVPIFVPKSYDPAVPAPLVILLHGFMNTGPEEEGNFGFSGVAAARGYLYATPTGSANFFGLNYWNATNACCDFQGTGDDHVGYLDGLIDFFEDNFNVDPDRIHLIGFSNGGFMVHRMVCERPERFASVVSIAGVTWQDAGLCPVPGAAHVAQIHGTSDAVVGYDGGTIIAAHPGAEETVDRWAFEMGCDATGVVDPIPLDLTANVAGAETTITRYETNCITGGSAELWRLDGGTHSYVMTDAGRAAIFDFLDAHPRPADCPGDLDGSASVDFADVLTVLASWGPCGGGVCPADLDEDGIVGFQDLLTVLSAWGACNAG